MIRSRPLTLSDRARQALALVLYEKAKRKRRMQRRLIRLAIIATTIALAARLFYVGTA